MNTSKYNIKALGGGEKPDTMPRKSDLKRFQIGLDY